VPPTLPAREAFNYMRNAKGQFIKGHNKGHKPYGGINTRFKKGHSSFCGIGFTHFAWKGEKASYTAPHKWVQRWKGKPDTCEHCGKSGLKGRQIHWANIDHTYRRVLDDYIALCAKCHKAYDKARGVKTNIR
jgi:hypothetical protein